MADKWQERWYPPRPKYKYNKNKVYNPEKKLCRVVPAKLAGIPNISEWLYSQSKRTISMYISLELNKIYRELASMLKERDFN